MLRAALMLALLCLAHGARLVKKAGEEGLVVQEGGEEARPRPELPAKIENDEDVKNIFRFMVATGVDLEKKLRMNAPDVMELVEDANTDLGAAEAKMEKFTESLITNFHETLGSYVMVVHGLGMLSSAIIEKQQEFKRTLGGCDRLQDVADSLGDTLDADEKKNASIAAINALNSDFHCVADDAARAKGLGLFIDMYKTSAITADQALDIVEMIARGIIKSKEDGIKIYGGAFSILSKLNPALAGKLAEAMGFRVKPKKTEEIARLLRTLLNEMDSRK